MKTCPKCNSSWVGERIPPEDQELFGDSTHFKRYIGIENPYIYDGLCAIKCPDCSSVFPVSEHPVHLDLFRKFKGASDEDIS